MKRVYVIVGWFDHTWSEEHVDLPDETPPDWLRSQAETQLMQRYSRVAFMQTGRIIDVPDASSV